MKRALKLIERTIHLLKVVPWLGIFRHYRKDANVVVTLGFLRHRKFGRELIIRELGYVIYLVENEIPFRITGINGRITNSTVLWAPSEYYDTYGFWRSNFSSFSSAQEMTSLLPLLCAPFQRSGYSSLL